MSDEPKAEPCRYGGGGPAVSTCKLPAGHAGHHERRRCARCGGLQIEGMWPARPGWDPAQCRRCGALYEGDSSERTESVSGNRDEAGGADLEKNRPLSPSMLEAGRSLARVTMRFLETVGVSWTDDLAELAFSAIDGWNAAVAARVEHERQQLATTDRAEELPTLTLLLGIPETAAAILAAANPPAEPPPQVPENTAGPAPAPGVSQSDPIAAGPTPDDRCPSAGCMVPLGDHPANHVHLRGLMPAACPRCGHRLDHHARTEDGQLCWCGCFAPGVVGYALSALAKARAARQGEALGRAIGRAAIAAADAAEGDEHGPFPADQQPPAAPADQQPAAPETWGICEINRKPHVLWRDHKCVGWVS